MSVLITGMHRSGTSVLAQLVASLGLTPGDGTLMPASPENQRGFFERYDVMGINDRWLGQLGGAWWAPPSTNPATWRRLPQGEIEKDRRTLDLLVGQDSNWFIKDPRISILLPLWDRLALQSTPVILGIRDPREVVNSLRLRNGFSSVRGLALWYAYVVDAIRTSQDRPRLVVDYAQTISSPYATVHSLITFLQSTGHRISDDVDISVVAAMVEHRLRRNVESGVTGLPDGAIEAAMDVYRLLAKYHGDADSLMDATFELPLWVQEVLAELSEVWEAETALAASTDRVEELVVQLDSVGDSSGVVLGLQAEIAAIQADRQMLEMRASTLQAEIADLEVDRDWRSAHELELAELESKSAALQSQIYDLEVDRIWRVTHEAEFAALEQLRDDLENQLEQVQASHQSIMTELGDQLQRYSSLAAQQSQDIVEKSTRISGLEEQLNEALERARAAEGEAFLARSENTTISNHADALAQDIKVLENAIDLDRAEVARLTEALSNTARELGNVQQNMVALTAENGVLAQALEDLREEHARVLAELETARADHGMFQAMVQRLSEDNALLEQSLSEQRAELAQTQEQLSLGSDREQQLSVALVKARTDQDSILQMYEQVSVEVTSRNRRIDELTSSMELLATRAQRQAAQVAALDEEVASLRRSAIETEIRNDELRESLADAESLARSVEAGLRESLADAERTLGSVETELAEAEIRLASARHERLRLQEGLDVLTQQVEDQRALAWQERERGEQYQSHIEGLVGDLTGAQEREHALLQDKMTLESKLDSLEETVLDLQRDIDRLDARLLIESTERSNIGRVLRQVMSERDHARHDLEIITSSRSYRYGRRLTAPARALRRQPKAAGPSPDEPRALES